MRNILKSLLFWAFFAISSNMNAQDNLFITYNSPATSQEEALPIGNRKLCAQIFGGASTDSLLLIDSDLLYDSNSSNPLRLKPFAKLTITNNNKGNVRYIERKLNLNRSLCTEEYEQDGVVYTKEFFASYPDNVIGIRLRCKQTENGNEKHSNSINCTLRLSSIFQKETNANSNNITLNGEIAGENERAIFNARIIVNSVDGGSVKTKDDAIVIKNAKEVTIYLINETSNYSDSKSYNVKKEAVSNELELHTERLKMKDFDKIRFYHISDYRNISARFTPSAKLSNEQFLSETFHNYLFFSWPQHR